MYLHLGSSVVIRQRDVVGIFDLDNTTSSRITRDFLTQAPRAPRFHSIAIHDIQYKLTTKSAFRQNSRLVQIRFLIRFQAAFFCVSLPCLDCQDRQKDRKSRCGGSPLLLQSPRNLHQHRK